MAAGKNQESYSSRFPNCKYQVFLSFRGEDTRKNFTDHLYTALVQAGIHTFRDDNEIRRGENIDFELQKAIQQSKISIIVFSKDYASSRWCLDELVMIMERKRNADCIVLPVFYDVDPSQVGRQPGSFTATSVEHEKSFNEEMERVNGWRIALKEVADLAGMVLGDGYEAQFVQSIVENVSKNLDQKIFHVPLHFIGRDPLIELQGNRLNVVVEYDENEMLGFYEEEGLIQKEFEEQLSFKISSPGTHRICGFNLFTWFSATPVSNPYLHVYLEIRDNTKDDPVVQIKRVGVRMLHEEEGTDDDSSSSNTSDDVHVTKAEIASHIFRNYYCSDRYDFDNEIIMRFFEKKLNVKIKMG